MTVTTEDRVDVRDMIEADEAAARAEGEAEDSPLGDHISLDGIVHPPLPLTISLVIRLPPATPGYHICGKSLLHSSH
jgi:hypothetical protein